MKRTYKVQSLKFRFFFIVGTLLIILSILASTVEARVYIDITSPAVKKLPIAVFDLQGPSGKEISEIIREDLIFTGLFQYIDKNSYIEAQEQQFDPKNWTGLGVEAVLKGQVTPENGLTVSIILYDTFEGREIFSKKYQSEKELQLQLGHSIANDIYAALTGQQGIFRTRIAFVGEDHGEKGIYIMDWDGRRTKKLGLKSSLVLSPHWAPDGNSIIYSSERGRQWGIFLLDFLKMTEKKVFVSRGTNMAGDFFPQGNAFVFSSSREGTPDLYLLNIKDYTAKKLTATHGIDVSPAVSSDGRIAFVSDRGGNPQIYVMNSDGSEVRRVTFEGSYNTSPSWSPRGDRIVFSGRRSGKNQIFLVKPDGSGLQQLTETGNNEDPSFSPDGRHITFSSDREKGKSIYLMRANGEAQKRITPKDLKAFGPRWSPN